MRDEKRAIEKKRERVARLSGTRATLPGTGHEKIQLGPREVHFEWARSSRMFLVRNCRHGAQMLARKELLEARRRRGAERGEIGQSPIAA